MSWMPRAIAPEVTTTTSSPAAWRAATWSQTRASTSAPQRAGVLGDDARTELDDVAGHGRRRLSGSSSNTTPPISTSSPGSKPAASSARTTPMRCRRCSMWASASSLSTSKRAMQALDRSAADAEGALPHRLDAPAAVGSRTEDAVLGELLLGGELRRRLRRLDGHTAQQLVGELVEPGAGGARGDEHRDVRAQALRATPRPRRRPRPACTRSALDSASSRGSEARRGSCAAQLVLDRLPVGHRVRAVQRREVEHVHEQPRALDVGQEVVAEARRRRWRPR